LNKNSQQIAIAKAFTNSFRYTLVFGKLPKNSATLIPRCYQVFCFVEISFFNLSASLSEDI